MTIAIEGFEQFEDLIKQHELVILDFWADWCAPCKAFSTVYEQLSEQYPHIAFGKINIQEAKELTETFQIRSIPHLMIVKKGIVIYSESGSMPESTLNELIEQALDVDISKIRSEMHEEIK